MIIFDLDGTLWNTTATTLEAAREISSKYDELKEITLSQVQRGMGLSEKENAKNYMPYLEEDKGIYYLRMIDSLNREKIASKGASIYDGVTDTIKHLSKNYSIGIVTNSWDDYARTFLKLSNLEEYFTDYIGAASYGISKGEAIKRIIEKNGNEKSIYVGDIEKDKIAANEAGATFIHAKYGFGPNVECKYHILDIKDLEKVIENME